MPANRLRVQLQYRNKDLDIVSERECSLNDYSALLKNGVIRLILDAEDLAYRATGGKSKEQWPPDVMSSFMRLRHKLLDMAGEIERLPGNLTLEPPPSLSSPRVSPVTFSPDVTGSDDDPSDKRWGFFGLGKGTD